MDNIKSKIIKVFKNLCAKFEYIVKFKKFKKSIKYDIGYLELAFLRQSLCSHILQFICW